MNARKGLFARVAKKTAFLAGHPLVFSASVLTVVGWALLGPAFHFSDTWQLVINTATTIITFLMVFLIQNTQNRDSQAVQIKLDELIRAVNGAHTVMMDLEDLTDEELSRVKGQYAALAQNAHQRLREGKSDTGTPGVRPQEPAA